MRCTTGAAAVLVVALVVALLYAPLGDVFPLTMVAATASSFQRCHVILDAGSSGTRALLYLFDVRRPVETISQAWVLKVEPGLSACAEAYGSTRECAERRVASIVALTYHRARVELGLDSLAALSQVNLYATAGLRLLTRSMQEQLLAGAARAIDNSRFAACVAPCARVISGAEEAKFSWLSANVALGLADSGAERGRLRTGSAAPTPSTVAVLDMGGASTQIAFVPSTTPTSATVQPLEVLNVAGVERSLYAVSRLGYGLNAMYSAVLRRGTGARASGSDAHAHPCLLRGVAEHVESDEGVPAHYVGRGDFDACRSLIKGWVAKSEVDGLGGLGKSPRTPRLAAGQPIVLLDNFNYMLGALWGGLNASVLATIPRARGGGGAGEADANGGAASAAKRAVASLPAPSIEQIAQRARVFCSTPWDDIFAHLSPRMRARYSSKKACFSAAYVVTLLVDVYHLDWKSRDAPIFFADTLAGFEASWALGAACDLIGATSEGM
jgi:hypothetical protein